MTKITMEQASELADMIMSEIKEEFKDKYISHNLVNTIVVNYSHTGADDGTADKIVIDIPAKMYDIGHFNKTGEIVYGPKKVGGTILESYDDLLEETGGFSGTHKHYLITRTLNAIKMWEEKNQLKLDKKFAEGKENE